MFFGLYDQPEIALLKKVLKKGDTFFDVGAYVGYYSLIASGIVGEKGQVHSFEPVPRLSDSLIKTVQQNGIRNITVNQVAVCEDEGIVSVYVADQSSLNLGTSSVFGTADQKTTVAVQRVSLDSYCAISSISRVNVMKVDIEGSEIECILGMKSLLNKTPPPDLLIEVNPKILRRRGLSSADLMDLLFQAQYRLFRIQDFPFRLILIQRGTEITTLLNLFCTQRALPTSLHAE
jgi:FkbM family methyltransferase